jgi:hypothetical protein
MFTLAECRLGVLTGSHRGEIEAANANNRCEKDPAGMKFSFPFKEATIRTSQCMARSLHSMYRGEHDWHDIGVWKAVKAL